MEIAYGNGWIPHRMLRPQYGDVSEFVPQFRAMATAAGRDPADIPVTLWGRSRNSTRCGDIACIWASPASSSEPGVQRRPTLVLQALPVLDQWADVMRRM